MTVAPYIGISDRMAVQIPDRNAVRSQDRLAVLGTTWRYNFNDGLQALGLGLRQIPLHDKPNPNGLDRAGR